MNTNHSKTIITIPKWEDFLCARTLANNIKITITQYQLTFHYLLFTIHPIWHLVSNTVIDCLLNNSTLANHLYHEHEP